MADPVANVVVSMPSQLFTRSDRFSAVANGKIYVGLIDSDPTVPGNQIQAYIENEDGSLTAIPQPLRLNSGGYPVYNGQVVKFVTEEGHSMAVLTSTDVQMFYFPNVLRYNPDQFGNQLASDSGAGMVGFSYSSTYPASTLGSRNKLVVCVLDKPFLADPTFTNDSYAAIQGAINYARDNNASVVWVPTGRYKISQGLIIPPGITLEGDGVDYWDTYRPAPTRLLKSWSKGTHLVFTGTGSKNKTFLNLANARDYKTLSGSPVAFTEFTNRDSAGGAPATAKAFSIAVTATHESQLKNLRIMLNFNGISGYNDAALSGVGDNWDIGLWLYDGYGFYLENVQVVGYWRTAAFLMTENDGTYTQVGNPESAIINNLYTQGERGLIIRNSPQWDVTAYTSSSVTCKYNSSWTLTSQNNFRIPGSTTLYSFASYTATASTITLTGVSPALTAQPSAIRSPNIGNNFSGTCFNDSKTNALDHTSGQSSVALGLGRAASMEVDGYPMRNLKFVNFKAQTVFDDVNTIFGGNNDFKFISSEFENGALVAYSNTETIGYTGNLRMFNTDIQSSVDISLFNPRDCFQDYRQLPTSLTTGVAVYKNWRTQGLEIQYGTGQYGLMLRDSDNNVQIANGTGFVHVTGQGSNNSLALKSAGFTIQTSTGTAMLSGFDSTNMSYPGVMTGGTLAVNTAVRPVTANVGTCGTASQPWAGGWTQTAFTVTSDETAKQDIRPLEDRERDVGRKLKDMVVAYRLKDRVESKGEDARLHIGVIAQRVIEAFESEGLNYGDYGIVCHEEWDEVPADEETGSPAVPAGSGYTVRYEELMMLIIGSM